MSWSYLSEVYSFAEKRHVAGLVATFSGFGASVLGMLKIISIVAGAGGAVFGFIAGYFTMRSAIRRWQNGK